MLYSKFAFAGDVLCTSCQHKFDFVTLEYFLANSRNSNSTEYINKKKLFLDSKPIPYRSDKLHMDIFSHQILLKNMSHEQILQIFEQMNIQTIAVDQVQNAQIYCDLPNGALYFPMTDVTDKIIGYKKLSYHQNELHEETSPDSHSFGAVHHQPMRKPQRGQRMAILVLNLLDYMSLVAAGTSRMYSNIILYVLYQLKY